MSPINYFLDNCRSLAQATKKKGSRRPKTPYSYLNSCLIRIKKKKKLLFNSIFPTYKEKKGSNLQKQHFI